MSFHVETSQNKMADLKNQPAEICLHLIKWFPILTRIIWEFLKTTDPQAPPHLDDEMCWKAELLRQFESSQISRFKHNLNFRDSNLMGLPPPINT